MLPGPLYAIDFKAGQNFEGQVEPFELAAGRAHPILSLTLADGRQVSLAHHPAIENPYPAGFPILPFYRAQQTPPRNCTCCGLPPPVPATRVADRDIGAVTPNLCGPESNSNDTGRSWPQARTTIIALMKLVIIRPPDMDVTDAQRCTSDVRKGRRESSALAKCHRAENQADWIELYHCACSSERDRLHGVDAIVVGYYRGEDLIYVARVRNGFVPASRRQVFARLKPLIISKCPFVNLPERHKGRWGEGLTAADMDKCVWVRPEIVARIEFLEWTASDHLRHSKFAGLREDKDARTVIKEHGGEVEDC